MKTLSAKGRPVRVVENPAGPGYERSCLSPRRETQSVGRVTGGRASGAEGRPARGLLGTGRARIFPRRRERMALTPSPGGSQPASSTCTGGLEAGSGAPGGFPAWRPLNKPISAYPVSSATISSCRAQTSRERSSSSRPAFRTRQLAASTSSPLAGRMASVVHKLRRAMVAPERSQLTGAVEVDETYVGGPDAGRRGGRDALGTAEIVIVAVEVRGAGSGRIRMEVVGDLSADALCGFVSDNVTPGATTPREAGLRPSAEESPCRPVPRRGRWRDRPARPPRDQQPQDLASGHLPRRFRWPPSVLSGWIRLSLQSPAHTYGRLPNAARPWVAPRTNTLQTDRAGTLVGWANRISSSRFIQRP